MIVKRAFASHQIFIFDLASLVNLLALAVIYFAGTIDWSTEKTYQSVRPPSNFRAIGRCARW